jgi:protein TonB
MSLLILPNLASWSVQVAAIVAAALVTLKLLRLDAAAVRYAFLRLVLAGCLLLPFAQPRVAATLAAGPALSVAGSTALPAAAKPSAEGRAAALFAPSSYRNWSGALAVILIGGMLARLAWTASGVIRLRALRRLGEVAQGNREHDELQSIIGTSAAIRYVDELGQPVTFGVWRPIVLLPVALLEQPLAIQRAVLAHELWHVRRRDWIWTVTEEVVRAVCWFHPGVWVLVSSIQSAREEVVDELTILATGSRRQYVNALLVFADRPPLFAATAFARRRHLMRRMILISREAVMSARRVVACGVVLVAVVCSTGWYSVQAFPLTQALDGRSLPKMQPGPLEGRAKPVTPENPVPRRTYFVPADYPAEAEAMGLNGSVTVRVTLDETGQIGETRPVGFSMNFGNRGRISASNLSTMDFTKLTATGVGTPGGLSADQYRSALLATMDAALRAVRQWHYAAPAEGPLSFLVTVAIGSPSATHGPPPPPPAPGPGAGSSVSWQMTDGALRVGGGIAPPMKTRNVNPVYPPEAQVNRVQGVVIIEARIETDGRVSQARVLRSIPLLDDAALDAVRQWEYTPTLLNGQAVPVVMTVTVNFTMQ